jgi:hypothetical protein
MKCYRDIDYVIVLIKVQLMPSLIKEKQTTSNQLAANDGIDSM